MKDKVINTRKYLNLSLTIIGMVLIIISLSISIYDYISIDNSIFISSEVVSLDVNKNTVTVKYRVNNKEYESQITNDSNYAVTDEVRIRVSIKNPLKHVEKHTIISISTIIIGIILLVITLKNSIFYIKREKNVHYLKLSGIYVQATITEIFVNNAGKKHKNFYPYKLRAKYLNPSDNNVYTFDSEDTFVNLGEILAKYGTKGVVVYIDKTNPNNYFVDLNSLIPHRNLIDPIEFMKQKASSSEPVEEVKDENTTNQEPTDKTAKEEKNESNQNSNEGISK